MWENPFSLTFHLKECLESRYENFISGLSVSVAKNLYSASGKNILLAIDNLMINYTVIKDDDNDDDDYDDYDDDDDDRNLNFFFLFCFQVEWPLTLIFTQNLMLKYNRIFRIALKLKWAHWTLSNLHFRSTPPQHHHHLFKTSS